MLMRMSRLFHWPDFLPAFARAAQAAGFAPTVLTTTEAGPLVAWERPDDGPRVYLSAGIHGDEPAGPLALLDLLGGGVFTPGIAWAICPALNPTGLAAGRRETSAGIDMNRDYWLRRTREVTAHAAWLESKPIPDLFLSLHEDWEAHDFYLYEINLGADHPRRARDIIAAVSPAIFLSKHHCPLSFTFETPSHAPLAARVAAHRAAVRAAIRQLPADLTNQIGEG
jgi:predicted deacylase